MPRAIIGGTQKAGTSALFDALVRHPEVRPPRCKEIHYFDAIHMRPLSWYRAHFPLAWGGGITLEATPFYLYGASCAQRIAAAMPDVRLVFLLRDPAERALSHWRHERKWGFERRDFADAIRDEMDRLRRGERYPEGSFADRHYSYIERGFYHEQIPLYLERFDREQILILDYAELDARPYDCLARVCVHFGIRPPAELQLPRSNVGLQYPLDASSETLVGLQDCYSPVYDYVRRQFGFEWSAR